MAELEYYVFTPIPPFEFKPRVFKLIQVNEDGTEVTIFTSENGTTETINQGSEAGQ